MRFGFTEDQELFAQTVAELLGNECTHEHLASAWETESGWIPGLWEKLAEVGILGLSVPEAHGGLALSEIDLVLILEEVGRAACPDPIAETVAIGAPLLAEVGGSHAEEWLPKIAAGEARIALGLEDSPYVAGAASADLLILQRGDALHALRPGEAKIEAKPSVDGARRLYSVDWSPGRDTLLAEGEPGRRLATRAFDRGALAAAAQLNGLGRALIDTTVEYAKGRVQFGQPIGAFQAIKHHLADTLTKLEFARPATYWAANSLSTEATTTALDVSTAKALASDAAQLCFRTSLQCRGAIAYTYEYHAHMWMKRVLVLAASYGSAAWHRRRAAGILLDA